MFESLEGENFSSIDDELHDNDDDYASYITPVLYPLEEGGIFTPCDLPKWKKTPRTAADFSETKSSSTLCRDSEYDAWLENYYQEIYQGRINRFFDEKEVNTSDLVDEKVDTVHKSLFPEIKRNAWSYNTKYLKPSDVRHHWPLLKRKNEYLYVPSIHPNLNLKSRYGRYHSLLNSAAAIPETTYKRVVCSITKKNVGALEVNHPQLLKFIYCDSLCNLKWFDFLTKSAIVRCLCRFLRTQIFLDKVSFENMNLEKLEGVVLLCALSRNGGDRIKELHMWKMFAYGQCPLLENELSKKGKSAKKKGMHLFLKIHYLQILFNFSNLTHLSMNYSYLANKKGDALLCLKCVRVGCLKELRLLCQKSERPFHTNPGYGVGGWSITDGVWRRATEWCPDLRVKFVFLNMPQYENVITFMSKSIPVSYVYLSSGIDLDFEVPWDIDSTLLEVRNWYSSTLETLCLHLWRHRDLLDFVIKAKILEEFPNLQTFEFIGVLEDIETLEVFCRQLSTGCYNLKTLLFWVEEQLTNRRKRANTVKRIAEIREKYKRKFQVLDLSADIQTYSL